VIPLLLALAVAPPAPGRPLFYWGARPAVIVTGVEPGTGVEAQVGEVHAALDGAGLVLRLTFDRSVRDALYLPGGAPVSGRLRATLYVDADAADSTTGWATGVSDRRSGADYRVEVGVLALGADPDEGLLAQALVTVFLAGLAEDGRHRSLWRGDDSATPRNVSVHDDAVELRLPVGAGAVRPGARLLLAAAGQLFEGRLGP